MLVTITTDASWDSKRKIGSYAFWAISNRFKILKSGVFKGEIDNSNSAEFKCIINAIHCVMQENGVTRIIVNTDSMHTIDFINKNTKSKLRSLLPYYEFAKGNAKVDFRHVKAHSTIDNARTWVNDWCDKKAKEALKKAQINKIAG